MLCIILLRIFSFIFKKQSKINMKSTIKNVPELYFIGLGIAWVIENYSSKGSINYVALLVTWLMFLQIFYKNKVLGIIYGNIMAAFSIYMIIQVFTEFDAFETLSFEAYKVLGFGSFIYGIGTLMGGAMVYKFATSKTNYDESVLTVTY